MMKVNNILFFLFLVLFSAKAEKKLNITKITLPYDSLRMQEIYSFGELILVRADNKIYKSTNNGTDWNIALNTDKVINHFYAGDPHSIFVVGDSGMVLRTFDYGESWIDLSYKSDKGYVYNFNSIASLDFNKYCVITSDKPFIHENNDSRGKLIPFDFKTDAKLYNIISTDSNYYFFGSKIERRYYNVYGDESLDMTIPYFEINDKTIKGRTTFYLHSGIKDNSASTDSLKLFRSKYGLYHVAHNKNSGSCGINLNFGVQNMYYYHENTIYIYNDNIINVFENSTNTDVFSRQGLYLSIPTDTLLESSRLKYENYEYYETEIQPINNVFKIDSSKYYISSNNSAIYIVETENIISNIELNDYENKLYKVIGNKILFSQNIDLLSVYNYLGIEVNYEYQSQNSIILPKGLNFITFSTKGESHTIKIAVFE